MMPRISCSRPRDMCGPRPDRECSLVANFIFALAVRRQRLRSDLGIVLGRPRERENGRDCQIKRLGGCTEPEVVDRLLGTQQALGDLLDLAGDRRGIAAVDRQLGDRLDLRLQVFDLGLQQFVVFPRFRQVGKSRSAGLEVRL